MELKELRTNFNNWKKTTEGKWIKERLMKDVCYLCPSCKTDLAKTKVHIHHMRPLSKLQPGEYHLATHYSNLVVLCHRCNLKQGNKVDIRFD